jgi:hypothetical protein
MTTERALLCLALCVGCAARASFADGGRDAGGVAGEAEDRDRDGRPDRWVERDAQRRPLKVSLDEDRDGRPDRVEIYVSGRLNRTDYDSDGDHRIDATDQYGADGAVNMTLWDRDWNTVPERWVQKNRRGQVTGEWIDANQDSVPERFRAFDPSGRATEEATDRDGDGIFEVNAIFNTRWSPTDHAVRVERDDDRDAIYERRETFTRAGVLRSVNEDTDHDGNRDHLILFFADGRIRKEGFDRDGDGWFEEWRFPLPNGDARIAHDDDDDYDIDRWDPPGPPPGWCAGRCATAPAARQPTP